ncbi:hypothetical protein [Corynebacterium sp. H130]|uniref:hypothetical protein n=1 Tax=Corynebacterium sp. H130 TaxID=3133444 RepID=UPI0030984001
MWKLVAIGTSAMLTAALATGLYDDQPWFWAIVFLFMIASFATLGLKKRPLDVIDVYRVHPPAPYFVAYPLSAMFSALGAFALLHLISDRVLTFVLFTILMAYSLFTATNQQERISRWQTREARAQLAAKLREPEVAEVAAQHEALMKKLLNLGAIDGTRVRIDYLAKQLDVPEIEVLQSSVALAKVGLADLSEVGGTYVELVSRD